jgi:hypothetical protein
MNFVFGEKPSEDDWADALLTSSAGGFETETVIASVKAVKRKPAVVSRVPVDASPESGIEVIKKQSIPHYSGV